MVVGIHIHTYIVHTHNVVIVIMMTCTSYYNIIVGD